MLMATLALHLASHGGAVHVVPRASCPAQLQPPLCGVHEVMACNCGAADERLGAPPLQRAPKIPRGRVMTHPLRNHAIAVVCHVRVSPGAVIRSVLAALQLHGLESALEGQSYVAGGQACADTAGAQSSGQGSRCRTCARMRSLEVPGAQLVSGG